MADVVQLKPKKSGGTCRQSRHALEGVAAVYVKPRLPRGAEIGSPIHRGNAIGQVAGPNQRQSVIKTGRIHSHLSAAGKGGE